MTKTDLYAGTTALSLGARGKLRPPAARAVGGGGAFTLAGRACVRSDSGALWNEWTLAFDDGRSAWLAEARGAFTLYAERPLAPAFESLVAGESVTTGLVTVEKGEAKRVATWGDVATAPKTYRYADLSSAEGDSVTVDYGETVPRMYVGRSFPLADLGLSVRDERPRFLRVAGSPTPPNGVELWLSLGDEGVLDGTRWRVIAVLARSVREDGERYGWEEYLLHDPAEGFRWLVVSDGHWSFVESVEPGRVAVDDEGALFEGDLHKPLSSGRARLDWATGELPWEATVGDESDVADYVRAPHLLSREATPDEVSWSRASYLPTAVLAKAFGKRVLPKPRGRAPHAPKK